MTAHDSIGARSAMTMPMTINRAVIKKIGRPEEEALVPRSKKRGAFL